MSISHADAPLPVIVPNVVGSDMRSASRRCSRRGHDRLRSGTVARDVPAGQIVKQNPPAGRGSSEEAASCWLTQLMRS